MEFLAKALCSRGPRRRLSRAAAPHPFYGVDRVDVIPMPCQAAGPPFPSALPEDTAKEKLGPQQSRVLTGSATHMPMHPPLPLMAVPTLTAR